MFSSSTLGELSQRYDEIWAKAILRKLAENMSGVCRDIFAHGYTRQSRNLVQDCGFFYGSIYIKCPRCLARRVALDR